MNGSRVTTRRVDSTLGAPETATCLMCGRGLPPYAVCCRRRAWMNVKRSIAALLKGQGTLA